MSGVSWMGSLPLLPRDPDVLVLAPDTNPKLIMSLPLPFVPLPSGAIGV
jgi:hypothetical protein